MFMFYSLFIFTTICCRSKTTNADAGVQVFSEPLEASIGSLANYPLVEETQTIVDTKSILHMDLDDEPAASAAMRKGGRERGLFNSNFPSQLSSTISALSSFLPSFHNNNNGIGGGSPMSSTGGLEVTVPPMSCSTKRMNNIYYDGPMTGMSRGVDSAQLCAAECWQVRKRGRRCDSVNYLASKKLCEMRQGTGLDSGQAHSLLSRNYGSVYVIPTQCQLLSADSGGGMTATPFGGGGTTSSAISTNVGGSTTAMSGGVCGRTYYESNINLQRMNGNQGRYKRAKQRIIGGTQAVPYSYPWMASLQQRTSHFCGGALIAVPGSKATRSDIIITAAHCLAERPSQLNVVLGAHNLGGSSIVRVKAKTYRMHEGYSKESTENDIGLIQLETPVEFTDKIQPVCLPEQGESIPIGEYGVVAGWGTLREGKVDLPGYLMQVAVPTIDDNTCYNAYPEEVNLKYMFCAGYQRGGKDSCQGDSGGPIVFKGGAGWTLRGVVSFGEGCARRDKPGVYTRVAYYRNWIDRTARQLSSVPLF